MSFTRNGTFKFKINPDRHNAVQNLIYSLLPTPLFFRYHLPLMLYGHARQPVFFYLKDPLSFFFRLSSHPSFQYSNQLVGTIYGELVLKDPLINLIEKYCKPRLQNPAVQVLKLSIHDL